MIVDSELPVADDDDDDVDDDVELELVVLLSCEVTVDEFELAIEIPSDTFEEDTLLLLLLLGVVRLSPVLLSLILELSITDSYSTGSARK